MPRFIAHAEFEFTALDVEDRGHRLRQLGAAAEPLGFEMIRGEVHPAPEGSERRGPTGFGPRVSSSDGESSRGRAPSLAPLTTEGEREEFRLRRAVPVACRFSDGTWITSSEVWDHGVVIRWAKSEPAHGSLLPVPGLTVADDLGTTYARRGGGASRNGRGSLGHAEFQPSPPPTATSLEIRGEAADDVVSVSLMA